MDCVAASCHEGTEQEEQMPLEPAPGLVARCVVLGAALESLAAVSFCVRAGNATCNATDSTFYALAVSTLLTGAGTVSGSGESLTLDL